jgi:hypothetical protein
MVNIKEFEAMKKCMLAFLVLLVGCAGKKEMAPSPAAPPSSVSSMQVSPAASAVMPTPPEAPQRSITSQSRQQRGKVLFLISEQNIDGQIVSWWGESAGEVRLSVTEPVLFNALTQAGFEVIDPSGRGPLRVAAPYRRIGLGDQGAMELAHTYGADYVVLGKALATSSQQPLHVTAADDEEEGYGGGRSRHASRYSHDHTDSNYAQRTNMRSASATITAKVIRLSDRKVVAFISGSGDAIHVNPVAAGKEALEQAAQQAAEALIAQLQQLSP